MTSVTPHAAVEPVVIDVNDPKFDPTAVWDAVHRGCPYTHAMSDAAVLVTKYDDVAAVARDDETFSSDHDVDETRRGYVRDGVRHPYKGISPIGYPYRMSFIEMDPPEVTPFRRLMNPLFAPPKVEQRRPRVIELTSLHLDRVIESGSIDFVYDLTSPVPALLTLEAVGIPTDHAVRYADVFHDMVALPHAKKVEVLGAYAELVAELHGLVELRRSEPADDWTTYLVEAQIDGKPVPDALIVETLNLMLAGGIDTTTALTSQAIRHLHGHHEHRERLIANPSLIESFCEEMLRYFSPVQMFSRTVTKDTSLLGRALAEGDRVVLCWAAANRDPAAFDEPARVRIDRAPNRHQAFGLGIHRCIGSHIARMLFQVMISQVLERMPDFVIDEERTAEYESKGVFGITSMPATFAPGKLSR